MIAPNNNNNPPAAAPPAAAPTAAPAPANAAGRQVRFAPPETYEELYTIRGDALRGDYTNFYTSYNDASIGAGDLYTRMVNADKKTIPLVFLFLSNVNGDDYVQSVHRPTMFNSNPIAPTNWDNYAFCIAGERMDDMANVYPFPRNAFEWIPNVVVPQIRDIDATINSTAYPWDDRDYLAQVDLTQNVRHDAISVRRMIQVPFFLVSMVLDTPIRPVTLYRRVQQELQTRPRAGLEPLVNWLRAAATRTNPTAIGGNPGLPSVHMGTFQAAFPPVHMWPRYLEFVKDLIKEDFVQLQEDRVSNQDRLLAALGTFNQASQVEREAAADARKEAAEARKAAAAAKADTTPRESFPFAVGIFRKLAMCPKTGEEDEDLPRLYHMLAKAKKSEYRLVMQNCIDQRAAEAGSVTDNPCIATKEVTDMIIQGKITGNIYQLDKLEVGLSPFTCGFPLAEDSVVAERTRRYDLQQSGEIRATLAELDQLHTKEVSLPTTQWQATQMLFGTSLVLDEIHGAEHAHAKNFRHFCKGGWNDIVSRIEAMSVADRAKLPHIYARLLREVQITMSDFFREMLKADITHTFPSYAYLREAVLKGQWNLLAEIPEAYLKKAKTPKSPTAGGDKGGVTPVLPSPPRTGPGARLSNPAPNTGWLNKFAASGKTVGQLRPFAPKDGDTEICLAYHLKGACFDNCGRKSTHKTLQGAPMRAMNKLLNDHCPPADGGATPPPTAAPESTA